MNRKRWNSSRFFKTQTSWLKGDCHSKWFITMRNPWVSGLLCFLGGSGMGREVGAACSSCSPPVLRWIWISFSISAPSKTKLQLAYHGPWFSITRQQRITFPLLSCMAKFKQSSVFWFSLITRIIEEENLFTAVNYMWGDVLLFQCSFAFPSPFDLSVHSDKTISCIYTKKNVILLQKIRNIFLFCKWIFQFTEDQR